MHRALDHVPQVMCMKGPFSSFPAALRPGLWGFTMFCPLCPGTRAQTPSWSKFGRRREGDSRLEGVREGYVGGRDVSELSYTPLSWAQ